MVLDSLFDSASVLIKCGLELLVQLIKEDFIDG